MSFGRKGEMAERLGEMNGFALEKPLSLIRSVKRMKEIFRCLGWILLLNMTGSVVTVAYCQEPAHPSVVTKNNTVPDVEKPKNGQPEVSDELKLAQSYEELGMKYKETKEFEKARTNLKKALKSYEALGLQEDILRIKAVLPELDEYKFKKVEAVAGNTLYATFFDNSTANSSGLNSSVVTYNSSAYGNTVFTSDKNSYFLQETQYRELRERFDQTAQTHLMNRQFDAAIATYRQAIAGSPYDYNRNVYWWDKIAAVYLESGNTDSAQTIHERLLKDARDLDLKSVEISQLRQLSGVYFELKKDHKALETLRQAFVMAQQTDDLAEAEKCLNDFQTYYKRKGDTEKQLELYLEFAAYVKRFADRKRSGLDPESLLMVEGKIRQLEKEKMLKDQLIESTGTFNYFLIGSVGVLLILLGLFVRALLAIKKKNKRIALQSLRREMNPHFIFNSLNSVNQFIAQNNELEANKYLTSYSNLMRSMMESSGKDFILLGKEIELLKKYLDLELMRFEDTFDFTISVDEQLDSDTVYIPNMLIQPNVENAIWHGLRYRNGKGLLQLCFTVEAGQMRVTVDDNGIGIAKSAELKTRNQKAHQSLGIKNVRERITLLNDLYGKKISYHLEEKPSPGQGTLVEIIFPLMNKLPG